MDLAELTAILRTFAKERDWERFHTQKNLAVSVAIEAAEPPVARLRGVLRG